MGHKEFISHAMHTVALRLGFFGVPIEIGDITRTPIHSIFLTRRKILRACVGVSDENIENTLRKLCRMLNDPYESIFTELSS